MPPSPTPLKIGYLWQYKTADMNKIAATVLHIKAVTNELRQRGHHVRLITFQDNHIAWTDNGTTWHTAPPQPPSLPFRALERLIRSLQSRLRLPFWRLFDSYHFARTCQPLLNSADVLYERYWLLASGGRMVANWLKKPIFYEVNGDIVAEYALLNKTLPPAQWRVIHRVTRWMFRQATVITVSQALGETVKKRWGAPHVQAIQNGADVALFAQQNQPARATPPTLIFVGSFKPWHGLDLLITAFHLVAQEHSTVRLCLVGDGPEREALQAQVTKLGLTDRVDFPGRVPLTQVATHLHQAHIAILNPRLNPASTAQSPLKLFEYMAAGKAIIAPHTPNYAQLLQHNHTALLIPPNSAPALAQAINQLLANTPLTQQLGQNAQQIALTQHSWTHTVTQIEQLMLASG